MWKGQNEIYYPHRKHLNEFLALNGEVEGIIQTRMSGGCNKQEIPSNRQKQSLKKPRHYEKD
ncbi:hypothetical protein KV34_17940 [Klebsiella aerogenes]|nr:hypothetical protein KV34_17940 [Klebsiella aerogenes]